MVPSERANFVSRESQVYYKTKANFEKCAEIPATTSGHLQLHALITCNSGQEFAGNSDLFPVWRHSFRHVARSWHLEFHCYMSCEHELAINGRAVAGKTPAI